MILRSINNFKIFPTNSQEIAQDKETSRQQETRDEESRYSCVDKVFPNGGLFGALTKALSYLVFGSGEQISHKVHSDMGSRPPFGKLKVVWYPFHCIFTDDDTGERKFIWEGMYSSTRSSL